MQLYSLLTQVHHLNQLIMKTATVVRLFLCSMLILTMGGIHPSDAQTIRKGPYLTYPGNNAQMQVLWQDDVTSADSIRWGTDQSMLSGTITSTEYGTDHQHKYTITELTPGTKYYYQVKIGTVAYNGTFTSAPATNSTSLKFFAYGDTRTYIEYHDQVAQKIDSTYTTDPGYQTFIISMGDLVSAGYNESPWTTGASTSIAGI